MVDKKSIMESVALGIYEEILQSQDEWDPQKPPQAFDEEILWETLINISETLETVTEPSKLFFETHYLNEDDSKLLLYNEDNLLVTNIRSAIGVAAGISGIAASLFTTPAPCIWHQNPIECNQCWCEPICIHSPVRQNDWESFMKMYRVFTLIQKTPEVFTNKRFVELLLKTDMTSFVSIHVAVPRLVSLYYGRLSETEKDDINYEDTTEE